MSLPFLLEIGTEEIPDWMIAPWLAEFQAHFREMLRANSLGGRVTWLEATPRRIAIRADEVAECQPDSYAGTPGPRLSAGENAKIRFAQKMGVAPEELYVEPNPKGDYYVARKHTPGKPAIEILARELPDLILRIRWPKSMYWTAKNGPRFIRPIRWIVALLGNDVVRFEIAGVASGNVTSGHRVLGAPQIQVTIENYEQELDNNFVVLSAKKREEIIRAQLGWVAPEAGDLVNNLVYLTEFPAVVKGTFDREFLELPEEILVTVMRHHQKYFAVVDADGRLTRGFSAVVNTHGDPDGRIREGNERVLRARFKDAKFFWETDQKKRLEDRILDLEHVTFQAKLGTYRQKTDRVTALVRDHLKGDQAAVQAAQLCKCDLTTELVKEFTELQGVVGGLYARKQREPEEVWTAIYDHYKPVSMDDSIPRNRTGQLVSIADKLDTLVSCFQIELIPTGSKDPFALRRAAQGVVKVLVEGKLRYSLKALLGGITKLEEFFLDRIRYYFKDIRGFKYDEINAILASGWDDLVDVEERLIAIQAVRPTENFEPLAASFKRIRNILKQAQFTGNGGAIDAALLEPGPESDLYHEFQRVRGDLANLPYRPALESIASLRPKVDLFFDKVLVNSQDPQIRQNRLTLLQTLLAEFSTIADFSEIVTNT